VSAPTLTSWNWLEVARHRHEFLDTFLAEFLAQWDASDMPRTR
jgi:hypothetical protein